MSNIERWWMLRFPSGAVRVAMDQRDDAGPQREMEARASGALLFRVVQAVEDYFRRPLTDDTETQVADRRSAVLAKVHAALGSSRR
jgi:hypothetical protein